MADRGLTRRMWQFGAAMLRVTGACSGEPAADTELEKGAPYPRDRSAPTGETPTSVAPPPPAPSLRTKRPGPKPLKDPFVDAQSEPVSTFGIDVDTASYTRVRASLAAGVFPQPNDVRTEELLNYFRYSYPASRGAAFGFLVDAARAPWNPEHRLVRIGIKGERWEVAKGDGAKKGRW